MKLLYFDHDHGTEVLLTIAFDRSALTVTFVYDRAPDPTHDELSRDVEPLVIEAVTRCSSVEELGGFGRALVRLMRTTPFSLQDPQARPFAAIPHDRLDLSGLGEGLPAARLGCRVPPEIVAEVRFRPRELEASDALCRLIEP